MSDRDWQAAAVGAGIVGVLIAIIAGRVPRRMRVLVVVSLTALATAAGIFAYRFITRPVTLTVVAASLDNDAPRLMSAIAKRMATNGARVRLKLIEQDSPQKAAETFGAGKADLIVTRADVGDLSGAQVIVSVTRAVVFLITPPGSPISSVAGLRDKTVGVVLSDVNKRLVDTLSREYDLARSHVKFVDVPPNDVPLAFKRHRIEALLVAMPLSPKYLARLRTAIPKTRSGAPGLIAIDSAGAIAASTLFYESYDLPAGTLLGSPAVPDDDLTTLRIPYYLLANSKLSDTVGAALAKAVMDARRDLIRDDPLISQISAPNTDKDTPEDLYFPIQPGAAAYFDGSEESFFDKYSDALFYGSMVLGFLASLATAAWKYMMMDEEAASRRASTRLWSILADIRQAQSDEELSRIEDRIDEIVQAELENPPGDDDAERQRLFDAMQLVLRRLEHAQDVRRREIAFESQASSKGAARQSESI